MHIRNNNTSSSSSNNDSSSAGGEDLRNDHGILDSGSKVSKSIAFGLTTLSAEMHAESHNNNRLPRSRAGSGSKQHSSRFNNNLLTLSVTDGLNETLTGQTFSKNNS